MMKSTSNLLWLGIMVTALLAGCGDKGPWDGPFGTKKGLDKKQIEQFAVLEKLSEASGRVTYTSRQAPDITGRADSYFYVIGDKSGLCVVTATVSRAADSSSPIPLKLTEKYGVPIKDPSTDWGVIWSSEKYKLESELLSIRMTFSGEKPDVTALVQASYIKAEDCR